MKPLWRKVLVYSALVLVLGALVLPKLGLFGDSKAQNGGPGGGGGGGPKGPQGPTVVEYQVITTAPLQEKLLSSGALSANESVEIHPEVSGIIESLSFQEGSRVQAGQVLFTLRADDLKAQLKKLEYSRQLAAANENRQKELLKREAISQQEYDIALTNLNTATAEITALKAQIEKTVIRAPFTGQVGLRAVSLGAYVNPSTKVCNLVSLDPIKIDFAIPAKYAGKIGSGQNIRFRVEGGTTAYSGTVFAVEPNVEAQTRTLALRAQAPNPGNKLLPGAFASVELVLKQEGQAITIPSQAIIPDLASKRVFVIKEGKAQPVVVTTGLRQAYNVEVTSGLSAGDTVIVSGIQLLKPGSVVAPKPYVAPSETL